MADENNNTPGPFDVQTVKLLVQLMSRHDLSEIDLREGDQRICLRRGPQTVAVSGPIPTYQAPAPAPLPASSGDRPTDKPATPSRTLLEIKSPMVGTFYAQEKPDLPPYVAVGSRVTPTTVVGLCEAMKLFNEIPAGCNGVVVEVLVQDKQPVEFEQVLFRVDPTS